MGKFYKINSVKELLIALMKNKVIDAVIVPMQSLTGVTYSPFLLKEIEQIEKSEPMAPIMSINIAKTVSSLTSKGALPFKTGVVLKPCELRAFRELVKLNQIKPENLITISYDCSGINSLKENETMREICEVCNFFTPEYADIQIYSIGCDTMLVKTDSEISSLNLEPADFVSEKRRKAVNEKYEKNLNHRESKLLEVRGNFKQMLKNCISCHNCMRVCPICFCQECFFESSAVDGNSVTYTMRAGRLQGLDFPENKLLFHIGRMNHMSVSCVGCGACEDACPADIPVSLMFATAGDSLKALFDYEPGKDIEEKVPFTCYMHDELHDFEQPYVEKIK